VLKVVKKTVKAKVAHKKKLDIKAKVKPEACFFLVDGSTIASIRELIDALEKMNDDVFYYHVTSDRHDFASWIRDVFAEAQLADKLAAARSRFECQAAILKHLLKDVL